MVYYKNLSPQTVQALLKHYGLKVQGVKSDQDIPFSFWGAPEAGREKNCLYIRGDTPVHSILHEACHFVCMPAQQRMLSLVDAKGTCMEENATCFMQILLADNLDGYNRHTLMRDMDEWGYSFRLGSAKAWFCEDADETRQWLIHQRIIHSDNKPTWKLRN